MAELLLSVQTLLNGYPSLPVAANAMDFIFTQAGSSFADGFIFPHTGREIVIMHNANAAAQTVTVPSVVDDKNRSGDITAYSLGASEYGVLPMLPVEGWRRSDGKLKLVASAANVEFAVLRIP